MQRIIFFGVRFEYFIDVNLPGGAVLPDREETQFFIECGKLLVIPGAGKQNLNTGNNSKCASCRVANGCVNSLPPAGS